MTPDTSAHRFSRAFRLPSLLSRLEARRSACWFAIAVAMILGRLALLPLIPFPQPQSNDEFSYILAADTFARGDLANPPLAHPEFFESPHILVQPFYGSKYPPGQGLALALGQKLGHFYWGVLLSGGLMVFLFCWAADAWLPRRWAFLAGLTTLVLFFPHYWFNSYWGGAVAASGGAFILGALGHLTRGRLGPARFTLGTGAALLYATRPYEGGVFCLAALIAMVFVFLRLPERKRFWGAVVLPNCAVLVLAGLLAGWYNWRITGNWRELPYVEHMRHEDPVPVFWVLPPLPERRYSAANVQALHDWETRTYRNLRDSSLPRAIALQLIFFSLAGVGMQFLGAGLLLFALPWAGLGGRKKWLILLFGAGIAALLPETFVQSHYTAPFTCVELILVVACARAVWYRIAASRRAGPLFFGLLLVLLPPLVIDYISFLRKPQPNRETATRALSAMGGRHLIFVRYQPGWDYLSEWVYNCARLSECPIVFAHDLGTEKDRELLPEFAGRKVWRLETGPALNQTKLKPFMELAPESGAALSSRAAAEPPPRAATILPR